MSRLVYVLDDDPVSADICVAILRSLQCRAQVYQDAETLLQKVQTHPPDVVFLDELTPGVDGLDISRRIREDLGLGTVKLVVMEKRREGKITVSASDVIADARLEKPFGHDQVQTLLSQLSHGKAEVRFWGVRGSIASPGTSHDRYGGNTSCVTIRLALDEYIIFDAGTGIREFGNYLVRLGLPVRLHLMITHAHWDHIQGLPFFRPAYLPQNTVEIYGCDQATVKFEKVIADQMKNTYFPVPLETMQAQRHFNTLDEGDYEVAGHHVRTMHLNHPGTTIGYRVTVRGKSMVYLCDNELNEDKPLVRERISAFIRGADLVVADAQYVPSDFPEKLGWGHSNYRDVIEVALDSEVRRLVLTHHDPDRSDDALDAMIRESRLSIAERRGDMQCMAAMEGTTLYL